MEYNGSAIMAMVGKDCVAIASDRRFGVQALTLSTKYEKVFPINDKIMLGLPGLGSDVETLKEKFRYKVNMYKLNEERDIAPKTFAHLVASTLYEKRY
jgi:20S proteasome subunit beta 3